MKEQIKLKKRNNIMAAFESVLELHSQSPYVGGQVNLLTQECLQIPPSCCHTFCITQLTEVSHPYTANSIKVVFRKA